ncbi:Uncharacterised protein [Mycobacteroides abscessus subsp. abscessus]|nr:Uncharacterised protein [Mycobacteroides abscessus subsp. abscessus]
MPRPVSTWLKRALPRTANRMSRFSRNSLPPPATLPSTRAMVACRSARNLPTRRWKDATDSDVRAVGDCRISTSR